MNRIQQPGFAAQKRACARRDHARRGPRPDRGSSCRATGKNFGGFPEASRRPGAPDCVRDYLDYLGRIVGHPKAASGASMSNRRGRSHLIFNRLRRWTLWLLGLTFLGVGARLGSQVFQAMYGGDNPAPAVWGRLLLLASLYCRLWVRRWKASITRVNSPVLRADPRLCRCLRGLCGADASTAGGKGCHPCAGPALSSQITQTMVDEMTEWHAVFSDRAQ